LVLEDGKLSIGHIYLSVNDMDRSISFWESLLELKVSHRTTDRWANFPEIGVYLGFYRPGFDGGKSLIGDNITLVLKSTHIENDRERISSLGATDVTNIRDAGASYRYFHFRDTEGNLIEVAQET